MYKEMKLSDSLAFLNHIKIKLRVNNSWIMVKSVNILSTLIK